MQGSLHSQVIAAKAVCLGEALADDFKAYGRAVVANARRLGEVLVERGVRLVAGGTDTHLLLLDLEALGLRGQQAQDALARVGITSNKNPVPFDSRKPSEWRGLRLGVAAATTRGLDAGAFAELGDVIGRSLEFAAAGAADSDFDDLAVRVQALCARYPIYA